LAPVASLVSVHHLKLRAGLVGPLSVISSTVLQCAGNLKFGFSVDQFQ